MDLKTPQKINRFDELKQLMKAGIGKNPTTSEMIKNDPLMERRTEKLLEIKKVIQGLYKLT